MQVWDSFHIQPPYLDYGDQGWNPDSPHNYFPISLHLCQQKEIFLKLNEVDSFGIWVFW